MIDSAGWVSWAERAPGDPRKQNGGRNAIAGFVAHSAEGFERYLRAYNTEHARYANERASWTFSNLLDGTLLQHFPVYAQVWCSGSQWPNNNLVPMEHEGIAGHQITPAQVQTTAKVIGELAVVGRWAPVRRETLWEHSECRRWGSAPTACPSDRIPWDEVLALLNPGPIPDEEVLPDMRIFKLAGNGDYLWVANMLHLIPTPAIYEEMKAVVYGEEPGTISQSTWEWLCQAGIYRAR